VHVCNVYLSVEAADGRTAHSNDWNGVNGMVSTTWKPYVYHSSDSIPAIVMSHPPFSRFISVCVSVCSVCECVCVWCGSVNVVCVSECLYGVCIYSLVSVCRLSAR
jgi:hypothetical protein